jgi:aspartate kinase
MSGAVAVIKIGGSVLTDLNAYQRVATFVAARRREGGGEKLVLVVSAEEGTTDALLATAEGLVEKPDPATLDLLWSTGELRSAAILTFCLHAVGVHAVALNVHQAGLVEEDGGTCGEGRASLRSLRLRAALAETDVVVAPGFLARADGDRVVSLGRGGSDLTAVLLAAGLRADRCELLKDVPGYFSSDPHRDPDARHLPSIDFEHALAMADAGCDLVQRHALEAARDARVPLVIRALEGTTATCVTTTSGIAR